MRKIVIFVIGLKYTHNKSFIEIQFNLVSEPLSSYFSPKAKLD